jgi:hypothetical protein
MNGVTGTYSGLFHQIVSIKVVGWIDKLFHDIGELPL